MLSIILRACVASVNLHAATLRDERLRVSGHRYGVVLTWTIGAQRA
ncbi:hypothetical protein OM076_27825 [Solirubrobacter ginsenosidimutans]|uniref:Uncharacterized protein n=1 Tax=Solirubrobacter ginsenosidimutans TaxID=490573 RepID=A0A9X3S316_9ACTN|nr:hypothetical protein [Solirubrobacter ginsenosidimutans]MDA0164114.1 hypothetical protein [Solirubrobacter ginsenosidimutans]